MAFHGKRVLIVEDEPLVAMMAEDILRDLGFEPVGPASSIPMAVALARHGAIDVALLDVNIGGDHVDPIAIVLRERNIPMVFATGYGKNYPGSSPDAIVIDKPYLHETLQRALLTALGDATSGQPACSPRQD